MAMMTMTMALLMTIYDDDDNDDENGDHNDDDDDDDKINRNSGQWLSLPISPLRCFAQSLTPSPPSSSS